MGDGEMKNLEISNISSDDGDVSMDVIKDIEATYFIKLPTNYMEFITKHNEAYLKADVFDYENPNTSKRNSDGLTFVNAERIHRIIDNIQSDEEPDLDVKYRFEDGLIPFGDNGGGDLICFDYRHDRDTNNPPIVIWNHDMGFDHRVVFIANNFEEFINMLHEPED
jgi:hypothetical protein